MSIQLKCLSHTPLRGLNDPGADVVAEVDAILAQSRAEVEAFDPELIVVFAPDHYNGLFYDLMPPFVIATAAESVADYQTLPGPLSIPKDIAMAMTRFILDSDIDIALSHRLQVDHGCTQTLEELTGSLTRYPVIPIIINSVAPPFGPYRRVRKLGEAVGRFLATLNKRVLILGTGGLSHEPPVPLLAEAPEDIANFLIAGRNPTPEARAARQARTIAARQIFGTPACPLTPQTGAVAFDCTTTQQHFEAHQGNSMWAGGTYTFTQTGRWDAATTRGRPRRPALPRHLPHRRRCPCRP